MPERFAFWEPRYTSGAIDVVAGGRLLPGDALYSSCGWDSGAVNTLAYVAHQKGVANRASGACWCDRNHIPSLVVYARVWSCNSRLLPHANVMEVLPAVSGFGYMYGGP